MSEISGNQLRITILATTAVLLSLGAIESRAEDSVATAFSKCAGIAEDSARLACYDAVATVLVSDQGSSAPAGAVAATTAAVAGAVPLTDDVGKERVEPKSADEQPRFTANVTACTKSAQSGQYYFTFENGQVWKQSNYRSLSFRSCAFDVEIAKSALGYEMYIPSKERTVRVARVR